MDSRRTFGRRPMPELPLSRRSGPQRSAPQPSVPQPSVPQPSVPQPRSPQPAIPVPQSLFPSAPSEPVPLSIEEEIEAWKAARGPVASFPWRQLSLMAGLCFGIASFVLPNTINDAVQWPLYLLAAISFYAGLHKRKAKAA